MHDYFSYGHFTKNENGLEQIEIQYKPSLLLRVFCLKGKTEAYECRILRTKAKDGTREFVEQWSCKQTGAVANAEKQKELRSIKKALCRCFV